VSAIIRLDRVAKTFATRSGPVHALDDVTLDFHDGEISAVIGQSGAGKSTLVRLINGLEQPTSGTVTVKGTNISRFSERQLRPLRGDIGLIFQQFNLFNSRTVYDNVGYPLKLAGWSGTETRARVTELLSFVGLTERAWTYPDQLSGGQKQRVGIARALARRPSILLADESTSALDPETTADVLALLRRINAELGVTVIVITHEMEVVRSIADRVAVLEHGRLIETGPTREIFAHPAAETTQRFLSTIIGQHPDAAEVDRLHRQNPGATLVDVPSVDAAAFGAALAELGRHQKVAFRIVHGGVIEIRDGALGNYTLALTGSPDDVAAAARRLTAISGDAAPAPGPQNTDNQADNQKEA